MYKIYTVVAHCTRLVGSAHTRILYYRVHAALLQIAAFCIQFNKVARRKRFAFDG